jgi:hypothetical protein
MLSPWAKRGATLMRILAVHEVLRIIRQVTGKPVYHVEYIQREDCEEYLTRTR